MCRKISNCEGYIWRSDSDRPEIITSEKCIELKNEEIPFIIEGQLFDGKTSFSIKYVDGNYLVKEYKVSSTDYIHIDNILRYYKSNRMGGKTLMFLEYWEPCKDSLCLDMDILLPTKNVFVGFKEEEEK